MTSTRDASNDASAETVNVALRDTGPLDVEREDVQVPSWPILRASRTVLLVVWKNLKLRGNRPTATILEVVVPLIAFVAFSVMTPRNEYFDASYFPGVPWMPPACVLQFDVPVPASFAQDITDSRRPLIPSLCQDAGRLAGPHVTVPFAPDTEEVRSVMRAACELRYAPPGVDLVAYGYTTLAKAPLRVTSGNTALPLPEKTDGAAEWKRDDPKEATSETASASSLENERRKLLFDAPPSPPPPPTWPACTPSGYPDEETMARAVASGASGGHDRAVAVAFEVSTFSEEADAVAKKISGYEIRARASSRGETHALEMQERLNDVFALLAGTGNVSRASVSDEAFQNPPTATLFRRFPGEPVYPTSTYGFVAQFLPLTLVCSWTYTLLVNAGNVAHERERGLEAAMRSFGVPLWMHWLGHFMSCAMLLGAATLFCGASVTSFGAAIFAAGDQSANFVFLLLFLTACAAISGTFVIATLANDASTASAGTAVAWLVTYLPYAAVSAGSSRSDFFLPKSALGIFAKCVFCFPPSSAQGMGFAAMAQWEASGIGSTWGNLWSVPPTNAAGDIGVPLGATFLILLSSAAGLAGAALRIDRARFRGKGRDERSRTDETKSTVDRGRSTETASIPVVAIVASNLRVEYPGENGEPPKLALRDLNLACPADEITVLLGHNGAGKSSAISRLVGAAVPSGGRATIGGHDAVTSSAKSRLGFCPQHDALWDDLTVEDHLDFVLRLRGRRSDGTSWLSGKELETRRAALLREVELRSKKRTRTKHLSGGMRRRLSVALAFAGNPEHVILDEPTAGVDPRARRQIQSFLQKKSKGKAVLVTTHHLDEAERLGTRVAILHQGILVASGSSEALKKKYDVGYSVVVTLLETRAREKESIAETLLRLFRGKVFKGNEPGEPDARATTVTREGAEAFGEVSFSWPGSLASSLPAALRELDARKTELGVAGYGLGSPSLDGVFRAVQRERGGRGDRNEGFAAQDRGQADAADAVDVVDAADAAATATADVSRDVVEIAPRAVGLPDGKTLFRKIGENGWNAPRSNWWTTVFAVANASLRAFARDRSRILATCVAPAVLLLLASGMAGFQPSSSTYGTSTHVPVSGNPKAYVFSCPTPSAAAAAVESRGAFLERDLASVASFAAERVPEQSVASSSFFDHDDATATANATVSSSAAACHAEESVWARFYGLHPSGLRGRRETEAVGVALGSGGVATATTVWWSSFRLRRAALAAVARAEALARFESVSFESSEASATASAAVSAVAERGGFRPWPKTDAQTRRALLSAAPGPATAAAAALLAIAMPPCLVAAAAAKDRASGLRRVLLVAGASKSAHWVGVLVSDLAVLIPSCLAQAVALGAAGWNALGGVDGASAVAALLFVNSIASLGVAHAVSLWIGEENAYKTFSTCLLVASVPATFLAGATYASDAVGDVQGAEVFFWIGKLFPGYATAQGVIETALKHAMRYERSVGVQNGKPFERLRGALLMASYEPRGDGVEGLLRFSLGIGVVSFLCAGSVDGLFDWTIRGARGGVRRERRKGKDDPETPDADVVAEETRLKALYFPRPGDSGSRITVFEDLESGVAGSRTDHSESESEREPDALRVFGLRKSYAGSSRPAVSNLWLGVKPGECFGLLGINGCGKTTTFRMCAGDLRPSGGRVEIGNSNQDSRTGAVGYCPQKDSIVASLTVYEHVSLVAAARGFARDDGHRFVSSAIAEAGLRSFSGTRAGSLSGGNKRKLCLAMALFGLRRNGLALLDEPTAGIDPAARASITALIRRTAKEKSTACVITSHAVEDIGALCDRVGVMVDGALRCLGAPQRLRSRHGKHLTLTIHTSAARSQTTRSEETNRARALDAFVTSVAPGARRSVVGAGAGAGAEGGSLSVSSGPEPPSSDSPARSDEAAAAARAFGFIENDDRLRTARRIASEGALRSEAVIGASSPSWELPASRVASLPDILEALEKRKALSFAERRLRDGASPGAETEPFDIEGYAVGQASLEDVFLEFASRGIAQSDAQMMAMEDALFAHRLALSKKKE